MNYLISIEAGTSHCCELAVALRKYIPLESMYMMRSAYGLDYIDTKGKIGIKYPEKGDVLILVSTTIFEQILTLFGASYFDNFKQVKVIIGDGGLMRRGDYFRSKLEPYEVFLHNCKMQFKGDLKAKIYYQPIKIDQKIEKTKALSIAHSPHSSFKFKEKGTNRIVEHLNGGLDLITDVTWKECIERKSKSHIFIDQIDHFAMQQFGWKGGIGKSGFEAMLLKSLVLSTGENDIPYVHVNKDNWQDKLEYYKSHWKERLQLTGEGYQWAVKHLDPDFQARNILE